MAKRLAGGGLELSPAETKRLVVALQVLAQIIPADGPGPEVPEGKSAKRFAAHVRWHVKRPHRSRSCQFCP